MLWMVLSVALSFLCVRVYRRRTRFLRLLRAERHANYALLRADPDFAAELGIAAAPVETARSLEDACSALGMGALLLNAQQSPQMRGQQLALLLNAQQAPQIRGQKLLAQQALSGPSASSKAAQRNEYLSALGGVLGGPAGAAAGSYGADLIHRLRRK